MRKAPTTNFTVTPSAKAANGEQLVFQTRHYDIITPLWGGGVKPGTADPVTVIRSTEIRGQLRFWWRATRGGIANGSVKRLREEEGKIWGTAAGEGKAGASKVQLSITIENRGEKRSYEEWKVPYATFPLKQAEESDLRNARLPIGVKFALNIIFPEVQHKDIEAALWAWETFGGLGARTRRGFGAIHCTLIEKTTAQSVSRIEPSFTAQNAETMIRDGLTDHVVNGKWPQNVPYLSSKTNFKVVSRRGWKNFDAWKYLIDQLQRFRQQRTGGRAGRSLWPEPDAIRRVTKRATPKLSTPKTTIDKYPRVAFGLPINFHFKDELQGDPYDVILEGIDSDRMASPLILRPLQSEDSGLALAIVLDTPHVPEGGVVLRKTAGKEKITSVDPTVTKGEAKLLSPLNGEPDILKAFLNTLK